MSERMSGSIDQLEGVLTVTGESDGTSGAKRFGALKGWMKALEGVLTGLQSKTVQQQSSWHVA